MLRLVLPVAATLAALAVPSVALAGTVEGGVTVMYFAAPGEENDVVVTKDSTGVTLTDSGAPVTAGPGCTAVTPNQAFCTGSRRQGIRLLLDDMDDQARLAAWFALGIVEGGEGADHLLDGGSDGDLDGGPGNDTLRGRWGDDRLIGGTGNDLMIGGNGEDWVAYLDRNDPVTVDLDGVADDGGPGEADDLRGIENIWGGSGDDVLIGDDGPNFILGEGGADLESGRGGADIVNGMQGSDKLDGGSGRDRLWGRDADDILRGGTGADQLEGDSGSDVLVGGRGRDRLMGQRGDDTIRARDAFRDVVKGGKGRDRARVDRRLDRVASIESVL